MKYAFQDNGALKEMNEQELAAADASSYILVLDRGVYADGVSYWAYIQVKPSRYKEFMRVSRSGEEKILENYGTIVKEGEGQEVPTYVKEEMQRLHGWDDNYMGKLETEIRAEQKVFLEKKEDKRLGDIVAMLKKKQS